MCSLHLGRRHLCSLFLRADSLCKLFEILLHGQFISFPSFINSSNYISIDTYIFILFFGLLSNITFIYLFICQKFSTFGYWKFLQLACLPLFKIISLLFGTTTCSRLTLYIYFPPQSSNQSFLQKALIPFPGE